MNYILSYLPKFSGWVTGGALSVFDGVDGGAVGVCGTLVDEEGGDGGAGVGDDGAGVGDGGAGVRDGGEGIEGVLPGDLPALFGNSTLLFLSIHKMKN